MPKDEGQPGWPIFGKNERDRNLPCARCNQTLHKRVPNRGKSLIQFKYMIAVSEWYIGRVMVKV